MIRASALALAVTATATATVAGARPAAAVLPATPETTPPVAPPLRLTDPDPRFLRFERIPPVGVPHRVTVTGEITIAVRIAPATSGDPPGLDTLDARRRLDAVVTTVERDDAAGRTELRVRVIDGESRFGSGDLVRLPIGRTIRVILAGDGPSDVQPADDGPELDVDTIEVLRGLLAMADLARTGDRRISGPEPDEAVVLGLDEPRSVGERWRLDPALVATWSDITVDDLPPTEAIAEAAATRPGPITRNGRVLDRLEMEMILRTSDDETAEFLRDIGARGSIDDGSAVITRTYELPREPGAVVPLEVMRNRMEATSSGLADVPAATMNLDAEATVIRVPITEDAAAAAIARAERARADGGGALRRANDRGRPWGLSFDALGADPAWALRDPADEQYLVAAEREDGAVLRILRPDRVGRNGFSMEGLDLAVRVVGTPGPGHAVGEPFDLRADPPRIRARYGMAPDVDRWFVSTIVDDRPVVAMLSQPRGRTAPPRIELMRLVSMATPSEASRAEIMAGHPGVLRLGGPRTAATPPPWLGLPGADIAARGPGWRLAIWTIPAAIPEAGVLVMLDAAAGMTGFSARPGASTLRIEAITRAGRPGSAAVTDSARLEVLRGEADTIVILGGADSAIARQTMLATLGRLIVDGPIRAGLPAVDDGPAGETVRARSAAGFLNGYGNQLLQLDLPEAAIDAFEQSLAITPGAAMVRFNRAAAVYQAGRLAEAATLIDTDSLLLALPLAQRLRARISLDAGDAEDARRRYEALLATIPDPASAANLVVAVRETAGPEAALARGTAWMETHGADAMVLLAMSIVAADAGDASRALALIERAIETAPEDPSLPPFRDRYRGLLEDG
jgi:hypothetical protein